MLTKVIVDGYRSLVDFSVDLRPGLNVIVGANGTGKTNFISFLDFLGEWIDIDLNSAIAVAQGAGSVFSQEKFTRDRAELNLEVFGRLNRPAVRHPYFYGSKVNVSGTYHYTATIAYLSDVPAVIVQHESLELELQDLHPFFAWRNTHYDGEKFRSRLDFSDEQHPAIKEMFDWDPDIKKGNVKLSERLSLQLSPEHSMFKAVMHTSEAFAAVAVDMVSLRSINIDPWLSRQPNPVGMHKEIGPKGEGLAAALYSLKRGRYSPFPSLKYSAHWLTPDEQENVYESIISWCREVNPNIDHIDVDLNFQAALLQASLRFRGQPQIDSFPLTRISDGTVKWIALLAVLHLERHLSTIEEPENFLHPFMQESFMSLCRQLITGDSTRGVIVSTHSPTILDCCSPHELIIFDLSKGITRASSVANRFELERKVNEGRFGLGYYYRNGGVYGAYRGDS